jgi:2-hydroxy-3-oxopropionate reductase
MGLMGQAFIGNLTAAGFDIQGYDPDPKRMQQLRERGGTPAESPAEAARGVQRLILSLPSIEIVREATLGDSGIAAGADAGLVVIDTTTARPRDSAAIGAELATQGIQFLDAAVSGTSAMAIEKDLIVIAGGDAAAYEAAQDVMEGFSRAAYYMGPAGSGALTKLIINLVLVGNAVALAEGMTLGMKAGVDTQRLLAVLKDGASGSKVMDQKGQKFIDAEYSPQGALPVATKDIGLMLEQGREHGSPLFVMSLAAQIMGAANAKHDPTNDYSVFIEVLREMAGLPVRV